MPSSRELFVGFIAHVDRGHVLSSSHPARDPKRDEQGAGLAVLDHRSSCLVTSCSCLVRARLPQLGGEGRAHSKHTFFGARFARNIGIRTCISHTNIANIVNQSQFSAKAPMFCTISKVFLPERTFYAPQMRNPVRDKQF